MSVPLFNGPQIDDLGIDGLPDQCLGLGFRFRLNQGGFGFAVRLCEGLMGFNLDAFEVVLCCERRISPTSVTDAAIPCPEESKLKAI